MVYSGFQCQNNYKTIQEEVQKAIKQIFNEDVIIYASGRTDAGVHAVKQCAHFDTEKNIKIQNIPPALNTYLPEDIRILDAKEVNDNFHARFSVKKKTYMYVFSMNKITSPLVSDLVCPLEYNININLIQEACKKLIGTHNFKAFCSSGTNSTNFERTIFEISCEQKQNYLIFKITGNGFLYNMVRIIVGTLIDIGRGKLNINCIENMLKTGDRSLGGKTAKSNGLYLYDIEY